MSLQIPSSSTSETFSTVVAYPTIKTLTEHDPVTLARIYKIAFLTLQDPSFTILTTPLQHTHEYLDMTKPISFTWTQDYPLFNWKRLEAELVLYWVRMWEVYGLVSWNFYLFLQPDGRVAITHFEDTGFVHWIDSQETGKRTAFWIAMPCTVNTQFFFNMSSFPDGFYERVKDTEGVSPVFSPLDSDVN